MRNLVAPLLTVPLLVLAPQPAAHAAGTCQGQAATIESAGGTTPVTGTEGPDVILVTGYGTINALGGDDVICSGGGTLDAGAGNDSVTVTLGGLNLQTAYLGSGVNHYTSIASVYDSVFSGTPSEPNLDVIDGGSAGDGVTVMLAPGSHPQVNRGFLEVQAVPGDTSAWDVQLPGTVSRDGVSMGTFTNLSALGLDFGPATSVTVHGTPGADNLRLGAGTVDASMGGGKDTVSFDRTHTVPTAGAIDFGKGKDLLSFDSTTRISLDLREGRGLGLTGLEESVLAAPKIRYQGATGDDKVYAIGCQVVLRGGAGNDRFAHANEDVAPSTPQCRQYKFRMFGQAGDDVLTGWRGRDFLDGGQGRDKANGRQNVDTCHAEVEEECER